jgi:hypothetical protein
MINSRHMAADDIAANFVLFEAPTAAAAVLLLWLFLATPHSSARSLYLGVCRIQSRCPEAVCNGVCMVAFGLEGGRSVGMQDSSKNRRGIATLPQGFAVHLQGQVVLLNLLSPALIHTQMSRLPPFVRYR